MTASTRRLMWSGAALTLACGVVVTVAQSADGTGPGSLAAVAAEIRQLRVVVEESTRRQTQTQALAVYLSAQQSRLVQASAKLDTARRELDAATLQSKDVSAKLTDITTAEETQPARSEMREVLQARRKQLQQEFERVSTQLQMAQSRETEASQLLQSEEARWTQLIGTLDQLVKK